ncbi:hypothetical protein BLNAU_13132 [Blattamonas nauphoetae]|uniref:Ankyrin repeat protein n=1 Tax=Blattamonas nauphoetae TaxID=2049346 RepID=A0ABQ9XNR7_9EUKA|nr:hypothetical protein BLNAU_13132 [Blattamonas nauphoetae]
MLKESDFLTNLFLSQPEILSNVFPLDATIKRLISENKLEITDSLGDSVIHSVCEMPMNIYIRPQTAIEKITCPLQFAMFLVSFFLSTGVSPNLSSSLTQKTLLHCAASVDNLPLVICLLKHGADPSLTTKTGLTPFHVACCTGAKNVVSFFLSAVSGITLTDFHFCSSLVVQTPTSSGHSAMDLAIRSNSGEIYAILSQQQHLSAHTSSQCEALLHDNLLTAVESVSPQIVAAIFKTASEEEQSVTFSSTFLTELLFVLSASPNQPCFLDQDSLHSLFPSLIALPNQPQRPTSTSPFENTTIPPTPSTAAPDSPRASNSNFDELFLTPHPNRRATSATLTQPTSQAFQSHNRFGTGSEQPIPSFPQIQRPVTVDDPTRVPKPGSPMSVNPNTPGHTTYPPSPSVETVHPIVTQQDTSPINRVLGPSSIEHRMKQCVYLICNQFPSQTDLAHALSSPNHLGNTVIDTNLKEYVRRQKIHMENFSVPAFTASVIEFLSENGLGRDDRSTNPHFTSDDQPKHHIFDDVFVHMDDTGQTPLHSAIAAGCIPLASFLLHNTSLSYSALTLPRLSARETCPSDSSSKTMSSLKVVGGRSAIFSVLQSESITMLDFVLSEASNTLKDAMVPLSSVSNLSSSQKTDDDSLISEFSLFLRLCDLEGTSPQVFLEELSEAPADTENQRDSPTNKDQLVKMFEDFLNNDSQQLMEHGIEIPSSFSIVIHTDSVSAIMNIGTSLLLIGSDSISLVAGSISTQFVPMFSFFPIFRTYSLFSILPSINSPELFSHFLEHLHDTRSFNAFSSESSFSLNCHIWDNLQTILQVDPETQHLAQLFISLETASDPQIPPLSRLLTQPFAHRGTSLLHVAAAHGQTRIVLAILLALFVLTTPPVQTSDAFFEFCVSHLQQANENGHTPIHLAAATQQTEILSMFNDSITSEIVFHPDNNRHNPFHFLLVSPFIVDRISTSASNNIPLTHHTYLLIVPQPIQNCVFSTFLPDRIQPNPPLFKSHSLQVQQLASIWCEKGRKAGVDMNDCLLEELASLSENSHLLELFSVVDQSSPLERNQSASTDPISLFSTFHQIPLSFSHLFHFHQSHRPLLQFGREQPQSFTREAKFWNIITSSTPHTPSIVKSIINSCPQALFSLLADQNTIFHSTVKATQASKSPLVSQQLHTLMHLTKHHLDQAGYPSLNVLATMLTLKNKDGQTPFHLCQSLETLTTLFNGLAECCLLSKDASPELSPIVKFLIHSADRFGNTIFHAIAANGEPLTFLYIIVSSQKVLRTLFGEETSKGMTIKALQSVNQAGCTPFDVLLATPPRSFPSLTSLITKAGALRSQAYEAHTIGLLPFRAYSLTIQYCLGILPTSSVPDNVSPIAALALTLNSDLFQETLREHDSPNVRASVYIGDVVVELRRCVALLQEPQLVLCIDTALNDIPALLFEENWNENMLLSLRSTLGLLSVTLQGEPLVHQALLTQVPQDIPDTEQDDDYIHPRSLILEQLLVKHIVHVDATNTHYDTPLALASKQLDEDSFFTILSFGPQLNVSLWNGEDSKPSTLLDVPLKMVNHMVSSLPLPKNGIVPPFLDILPKSTPPTQDDLLRSFLPPSDPRIQLNKFLKDKNGALLGHLVQCQLDESATNLPQKEKDELLIDLLQADPHLAINLLLRGQPPPPIRLRGRLFVEEWEEAEPEGGRGRVNQKKKWRDGHFECDEGVVVWQLSRQHDPAIQHSLPWEGTLILSGTDRVSLNLDLSFPCAEIVTTENLIFGDASLIIRFSTHKQAILFVQITRMQFLHLLVRKQVYQSQGKIQENELYSKITFDPDDETWLADTAPLSTLFSFLIHSTSQHSEAP